MRRIHPRLDAVETSALERLCAAWGCSADAAARRAIVEADARHKPCPFTARQLEILRELVALGASWALHESDEAAPSVVLSWRDGAVIDPARVRELAAEWGQLAHTTPANASHMSGTAP